MDPQLAHFLKETQHDPKYKEQLSSNALSIVFVLGGIENVLTLCLTHPDADKDYCGQVLTSIKQLIPQLDNKVTATSDNLGDFQPPRLALVPSTSGTGTITPIKASTSPLQDSQPIATKTIMVQNPIEYYQSAIIFNPVMNSNLYFKWLNYDRASWMMSIVFNKWYGFGYVTAVCVIFFLASMVEMIYGSNNSVYLIFTILSGILPIFLGIFLILSMNLDIIEIIYNSFDFWFKIWNLIIWEFSYMWINIKSENRIAIDWILGMLSAVVSFLTIFTIDALPVDYKIKRKALFSIALIFLYLIIVRYFTYDELYIHPLGSYSPKHTRINVKSLFLGSYANIVLFVAKPVLGDVGRWLLRKYLQYTQNIRFQSDNDNDNDNDNDKQQVERFVSLYKRSKVKWNKRKIISKHVKSIDNL